MTKQKKKTLLILTVRFCLKPPRGWPQVQMKLKLVQHKAATGPTQVLRVPMADAFNRCTVALISRHMAYALVSPERNTKEYQNVCPIHNCCAIIVQFWETQVLLYFRETKSDRSANRKSVRTFQKWIKVFQIWIIATILIFYLFSTFDSPTFIFLFICGSK